MLNKIPWNKIELLAATGLPGGFKVFVFFLIQYAYDSTTLGRVATLLSMAQILAYFTAIGWCSLLIVRVAKCENIKNQLLVYNSLLVMGGITTVLISIGIFLISFIVEIDNLLTFILLLISWSWYQFQRHYILALKCYKLIIKFDLILLLLAAVLILLIDPIIALYVSFFLISFVMMLYQQKGFKITPFKLSYDFKGVSFGFNNFFSGGITLSLIPLANFFNGVDFAGFISLFLSLSALAMLFPRAISLFQLPTLSEKINDPSIFTLTDTMKKQMLLCNFLTCIVNLFLALFIISFMNVGDNVYHNFFILISFVFNYLFTTQSLIGANVLMALEKSKVLLLLSFNSALVFFAVCFLLSKSSYGNSFFIISVLLASLALAKWLILESIYKSELKCQ
ncbi:hypothetical protein [Pseudoalteromonas fuliginea]|uniref:Polysaccharide biosynthesis protein n=1 Tax=Pseudoalteromonas fuliginea TaxID=1872678 RepID=A0ABD3Y5M3_9GAMM|nr:hypothetical protein [Pseudoalteromonas fuliginea]KDC49481.1 hypothetical protein DC53_16700 [Pseudoalteromonas fuliginea]KJZ27709.1 hypothetical protein TW82_10690 [Pseudoalteromonas fuliginea]